MSTSAESTLSIVTDSPSATHAFARRIGSACRGGEVITLDGPLGAGKTTFTKGLAEGLGIDPRDVTSPTFLLMHELAGRLRLCHLDAYRVGDAQELEEIGARETFRSDSVVVVEWADRVAGLLPADRLAVDMDYVEEESRRIDFRARGSLASRLLSILGGEDNA